MSGGVKTPLYWRVLDDNTGAVIIEDLFHLHQSSFTVKATRPGFPGVSGIGDFSILLPPVKDDRWKANFEDYIQLEVGQRVEAYLGRRGRRPRFSGVITNPPKMSFGATEITGQDSLVLLQDTLLYPGEVLGPGGTTFDLMNIAAGHRQVVWDDDFGNWSGGGFGPTSANYNNGTGLWSHVNNDPYFNAPAMFLGSSGASLTTTATWAVNSEYNWVSPPQFATASGISIEGTMEAGTDTSAAITAEVLFMTDSTFANGYMARALMKQTGVGTGLYNVDLEIWQALGGGFTRLQLVSNVLTNVPRILNYELQVVLYNQGNNHFIRALLNGNDPNCVATIASPIVASGGIGLRSAWAAGGIPQLYVNKIRFDSRVGHWGTYRFGINILASYTGFSEALVSNGQNHLDIIGLAATMDGAGFRKNPGRGITGDTFDFDRGTLDGGTVGADLSKKFTFREDVDVVDISLSPTSDRFATFSKINAIPGGTSGGSISFGPRADVGDIVVTSTVADVGAPGASLLMAYARAVGQRRRDQSAAIELTVRRTAKTAEKWRELDYVTLDLPSFNINNQIYQILGYTFDETTPLQKIWFSDFPDRRSIDTSAARLSGPIEFLTNTFKTR